MGGFSVDTSASGGVFYALAALYLPIVLWCAWKLAQQMTMASEWSVQKSIHLLLGTTAGVRVVFFSGLPTATTQYFYVQMTGESAETWLYILDELPSLLELLVMGMLIHMWARSYFIASQRHEEYLACQFRVLVSCLAFMLLLQISIWIAYDLTTYASDALAVTEGSAYSAAFFATAGGLAWYGYRAAGIGASLSSAGLHTRQRFTRRVWCQSIVCAVALTLRAIASLGASIAAALQWDTATSEATPLGLALTFLVFGGLEITPMAVILYQNRHVAGLKGCMAAPLSYVVAALRRPCTRCCTRAARAPPSLPASVLAHASATRLMRASMSSVGLGPRPEHSGLAVGDGMPGDVPLSVVPSPTRASAAAAAAAGTGGDRFDEDAAGAVTVPLLSS